MTVIVMTDGHENAGAEWTKGIVQQLVSQQTEVYDWDFVFLGANMDAIDVGTALGFSADKSLNWDASGAGVAGAFDAMTSYTNRKLARGKAPASSIGFDDAERRRARGR